MAYIMIGVFLAAIAIGGPIAAVMCGAGGIFYMFYLCFKWGPKLSLIAIPVSILVFLCMWLDDFALMYYKHMLLYVLIALVVTFLFCFWYFEEDYKHIVFGVTAGVAALTVIVLAVWMYAPRQFPLSDRIDTAQVQLMSESIQAVFPGTEELDALLEKLDRVEMRGSFEELTGTRRNNRTYRLTFLDKKGKEIATYYFFSKYDIAKKSGKRLIFYRDTEKHRFPYETLVSMYANAVEQDK